MCRIQPSIAPPRHDPGLARRLPVPRSRRSGHLCRQGQEPAAAAEFLLRRHRRAAPADRADGDQRGGVEWTVVSTEVEALQLEYNWIKEFDPRFNVRYRDDKSYPELAVTRGRGVPAAAGDARPAPQGRPVLRALRPRLGDPGDAGHAAAGVPGPDLLGRGVPPVATDRPAVPARLHRQVLGALRRPGDAPTSTARSSTTSATSWPARPTR